MNLKFDIIGVGVFVENTNKKKDPRQSMDPKILADLRPQADSSAVRTSLVEQSNCIFAVNTRKTKNSTKH